MNGRTQPKNSDRNKRRKIKRGRRKKKRKKKENLVNTNQQRTKKIGTKYLLSSMQRPETFSAKKGKSQEFLVQIKNYLSVSDFADGEKMAITSFSLERLRSTME
jgi:hypothetical protein